MFQGFISHFCKFTSLRFRQSETGHHLSPAGGGGGGIGGYGGGRGF